MQLQDGWHTAFSRASDPEQYERLLAERRGLETVMIEILKHHDRSYLIWHDVKSLVSKMASTLVFA